MIMKSFFSRFWSFIVFARFPLLVLAFFWLFTVNVYASCSTTNYGGISALSASFICEKGSCGGTRCDFKQTGVASCATIQCPSTYFSGGRYYTNIVPHSVSMSWGYGYGSYYCRTGQSDYNDCRGLTSLQNATCSALNYCSTQAEADSLNCELNPGSEGCEDRCSVYRQQCEQLGGHFEGHQVPNGCAATCNTCGARASQIIMDIKVQSCCSQGLAPEVDRMCFTPDQAQNNPGMQVSTNADLVCVDPNIDDENLALYVEYCSDEPPGSSSSQTTSSSGGSGDGSSSSGESSSSGDDNNSSGSGGAGDAYNYYPILDTIRDSLVNIRKNVQNIYTCMITPGTCTGLTPQVTVNVPSDSSFLKNINSTINTTNTLLDSSLRNGNERLKNAIASANDTLIDSLRKFLNNSNDHTVDTLHNIHNSINDLAGNISGRLGYGDTATSTLRDELRGYFTGVEVDTGAVGFANTWVSEGEALGDSLGRAIGWIGGLDSVDIDSVFRAGGFDSLSVDSVSAAVDDSLSGVADSLNSILVAQNDSIKRGLPDSLDAWADSLASYSPFASFDSLIFGQLGAKIPNSNQCPDDCNKWSINLPRFGLFNFTIDYGLCLGRVPLGGMNVLGFIRLLLRIVVVWSCIWIVFNALTRRKD